MPCPRADQTLGCKAVQLALAQTTPALTSFLGHRRLLFPVRRLDTLGRGHRWGNYVARTTLRKVDLILYSEFLYFCFCSVFARARVCVCACLCVHACVCVVWVPLATLARHIVTPALKPFCHNIVILFLFPCTDPIPRVHHWPVACVGPQP